MRYFRTINRTYDEYLVLTKESNFNSWYGFVISNENPTVPNILFPTKRTYTLENLDGNFLISRNREGIWDLQCEPAWYVEEINEKEFNSNIMLLNLEK